MKRLTISNLYNLDRTIAKDLFEGLTYPWEALPLIGDFIIKKGNTLDPEIYEKRGENIWIAKSAKVFDSVYLNGPLIIDENAEVRQCAFIRGNAIIGKGATVGNSTELKNSDGLNPHQILYELACEHLDSSASDIQNQHLDISLRDPSLPLPYV